MSKIKKISVIAFLVISVAVSVAYKSDFFEIAKQIEIYTTLFKELNMYYIDEINPAKINQVGINSMLHSLDPYTRFYDEQGIETVRINANGQFGGTGAISKFRGNKLIVTDIYQNTPASKASVFIGDEILAINNIKINAKQKESTLSQLRGLPDTEITLKLKRQDKVIEKKLKLSSIIQNPVSFSTMLAKNTGYIVLSRFNEKAFDEVESAFLKLKEQGMTQLVLDLRANPGGLLNQAIDIVSLFVPKGQLVVSTKAKVKKWSNTYRTQKEPLDISMPLVVLVNGRSASASEIVSGALQDLDRAVIVGQRSYGKGLVQRYRKLSYGTQFKLTISKYYTPSGRNIQELDYTNRKGDSIPKFSDLKRPEYKTKNGRKILGGGGIAPDVKVTLNKQSETTKKLLKSQAVFKFATQYFYKHKTINSAENFKLSQTDFKNFTSFLKSEDIFVSPVQKSFKKSSDLATKANINIEKTLSKLNAEIVSKQFSQLQQDKTIIEEKLALEIVRRYYFSEGKYTYALQNDKILQKALSVLNDTTIYQKLLH
ncbi:MAG: S41 family peptidase [Flavobacteriaceae bacterium]